MAWAKYKAEATWVAEHKDEKPPKTRFQVMVDFMKEKFAAETEEMKNCCEEYQTVWQVEQGTPDPVTPESTRNTDFQV